MNQITNQSAGFPQMITAALTRLKQQLRRDYEKAHPQSSEIIQLVLDEEESRAWELTAFPHLLLPDLVEARVGQLNLRTVKAKHPSVFATPERTRPVFAFCT